MAERNRLLDYMPEGSDPTYGQDYNRLMSDTVVDRASVLPLATYADGGTRLAVPGMLQSPWDAFWNAGQAASRGDWRGAGHAAGEAAGAAMVGGLVSPKPAGALGTFGGRLAKTADHSALGRAEDMAAQGMPREQIWNDTGWFQGVDGKWRFEIDDSGVRLSDHYYRGRLQTAAVAPEAIVEGYHLDDGFHIAASGANPNGMGSKGSGGGTSAYHTLINDLLENGITVFSDAAVSGDAQRIYSGLKDRGYDVVRSPSARPTSQVPTTLMTESGSRADPVFTVRPFTDRSDSNAVLARTTMARISMTPEQRRARAPWLDYDTPEDQQIVRSR